MGLEWETGEDNSLGKQFLNEPGWYHFVVTDSTENPIKNDGTLIENGMFSVDCVAAAGTTPGCKDKTKDLTFFYPKSTDKDGGEFGRKKIDRALIALNVIDPSDRNKKIKIDAEKMAGQQFIAKLKLRDGKTRVELDGLHIYHVDDPEVAGQPKSEQMLSIIPAKFRRVGARTKPATKDPSNGAKQPPADPAEAAQAAPLDVNSLDI